MLDIDFKELYNRTKETIKYNKANKLPTWQNFEFKPSKEFMPELLLAFGEFTVAIINNKVNPSQTLEMLKSKDLNLAYALAFTNLVFRSGLYPGSGSANSRYCALVPLFMSAQKEYKGIKYDDWDKTDPNIRHFVGYQLWDSIADYLNYRKGIDDKLPELRHAALNYVNGRGEAVVVKATEWPRHTIHIAPNLKWSKSDYVRHIKLQTWLANIETRNEYMILDTIHWDNIPPPMDASLPQSVELEDEGLPF